MDIGESSSNYVNDTPGMSGDTNLSRKSYDELSKIVVDLVETNKNQELKKQQEMNDRLRAQERYTSKDCAIICNPPFDSEDQRNVLKNTLIFFDKYLGIKLREDRIKACHILLGTGSHVCPDSVKCKFVYFDEKYRVFGAKRENEKVEEPIEQFEIVYQREATKA